MTLSFNEFTIGACVANFLQDCKRKHLAIDLGGVLGNWHGNGMNNFDTFYSINIYKCISLTHHIFEIMHVVFRILSVYNYALREKISCSYTKSLNVVGLTSNNLFKKFKYSIYISLDYVHHHTSAPQLITAPTYTSND